MFSTMPNTGTSILRNIARPLRASKRATSCGVVTITAPATVTFWITDSWASPVPGGMSRIRKSSAPQSTSPSICSIAFITIGPRQMTGVSVSRMNPRDMSLMPYFSKGRMRLPMTTGRSSIPNIVGNDGP